MNSCAQWNRNVILLVVALVAPACGKFVSSDESLRPESSQGFFEEDSATVGVSPRAPSRSNPSPSGSAASAGSAAARSGTAQKTAPAASQDRKKKTSNQTAQQESKPQPPKKKTPPAPRFPIPNTLNREEIGEMGALKPTVYFYPRYDEDRGTCEEKAKVSIFNTRGERMFKVCPRTRFGCRLQGACIVTIDGKEHAINIESRVNKQDRFFDISDSDCKFGYGVNSSCLDPFHTLAADLTKYHSGDVIYVPAVAGLELPDGRKHDGFFVIRDKGRGIRGQGRFDFYSGFLSWRDATNPFVKIGLADKHTSVPYYKIKGARAEKIRQARNFPRLPDPPPSRSTAD